MEKQQKYLYSLKNGEKFTHNGHIYTVYQHEGNMSEVFSNGKWYAWPNWNGVQNTKVEPFIMK
jgi:hypothetical protein